MEKMAFDIFTDHVGISSLCRPIVCSKQETQYSCKLYVLQICDFGLAKWWEHAATQTTTEKRRGTLVYMAPEVLKDPSVSRTIKYDVYAFGILFWALLSGEKPFKNGTELPILYI